MKKLFLILLFLPVFAKSQIITTIAGNGIGGYAGDNGPALLANINPFNSITVDKFGNIYFTDAVDNVIRKINVSGIITTFAGTGIAGYSGDGGLAVNAQIDIPYCVTTDTFGNIYFNDGLTVIRKVDTSGFISTVVGNGTWGFSGDGGSATSASLYGNSGGGDFFKVDDSGNIFIADFGNNRIRKVTYSTGIINTIAGTGIAGYSGDGGMADSAQIYLPLSLALDHLGNIYIGDQNNYRVRKINSSGIINTVIGNGYACIGSGGENIQADSACVNSLVCISTDLNNNLYICDQYYRTIREINYSDNIVHTIVGGGTAGLGDGGPPLMAEIYALGMVVDKSGNIYIADIGSSRIREVIYDESVQTINNKSTFTIFPNPATTSLTINIPDNTSLSFGEGRGEVITITNLLGQTIYTQQQTTALQQTIDVSTFPTGIYFIKINGTEVRKFVKE